jgi:hypothetical protein
MNRLGFWVVALVFSAGLMAVPAMAQHNDADDIGSITRTGGGAETRLSNRGLQVNTPEFSMRMTTRVQFRFTHQQEVANGEDGTNGRNFNNFRVRRAKTQFTGHIFDEQFTYELTLNWLAGGDGIVETARFRWSIMQYFNVNAGQHKMPQNWEEITSSGNQQFVDRGVVNWAFTQAFGKGVWVDGRIGDDVPWLKYNFGIYNGRLRADNDFRNSDQARIGDSFSDGRVDTDMQINLRLETHPFGNLGYSMNDMRSEDAHDQMLLAIGLGVNYFISGFDDEDLRPDDSGAGNTASGRSRTYQDTWLATLDANFRWMGISAYAAFFYRHTEFHNRGSNSANPGRPSKSGISNLTDMGIALEVAYFIIPQTFNVGIRFNHLAPDKFWGNGSDRNERGIMPEINEVGVSANYYLHGNNLKLTMDILHVAQRTAIAYNGGTLRGPYNSVPSQGAFNPNQTGSDYNNLWIVRMQLQWIF